MSNINTPEYDPYADEYLACHEFYEEHDYTEDVIRAGWDETVDNIWFFIKEEIDSLAGKDEQVRAAFVAAKQTEMDAIRQRCKEGCEAEIKEYRARKATV